MVDVETTTHNKGNPFDLANKLVIICIGNDKHQLSLTEFKLAKEYLDKASVIIGANLKFDLNWLNR